MLQVRIGEEEAARTRETTRETETDGTTEGRGEEESLGAERGTTLFRLMVTAKIMDILFLPLQNIVFLKNNYSLIKGQLLK